MTLHTYRHPTENRAFYSPDTEPTLDLAVPILHISGLNNYSLPRPRLMINPQVNGWGAAPNSGSGPSGGYMGRDFRAAYVPDTALNGTGQTVGLLQFDGYTASDITYYENLAGLPNVPLQNVLVDGASGLPSGGGGEVEVSLDIEMAISMATNLSKVMVYEAPNPSPFVDLLSRMANDNLAKQLSCSWYVPNGVAEPAADVIFQQMAAQGQSFFSASGDYDAFTGLIPFPGDTPYITEVGGTTLTTTGPGGSYTSETVWNRGNGIGSGGGISTQYPIPNWQTNVSMAGNQGSTTMRNVPDVALTAENVYVRADGSDQNVGGTSCAAPLCAGFMALVNQQAAATGKPPIGFVNPAIYTIGAAANYTSVFHDTTTGNNTSSSSPTKFYATAGYDLCTGWGTPAGQKLIDALAPPIIVRLPLSATEGDGLLAGAGHIQLPSAQAMDVTVSLNSSDPSQVTVPATVTILAGNTNASFNLTILDDGVLDGTQIATITASVPGLGSGSGSMTIYDKETATLQVALTATVTKGQGAVPGAMQVRAPVGANVTVALTSDTTNLIQVPALVVIPTGQTSAVFTATILTDGQINGGQTVHVTAHVQNWTDGVAAVAVRDNVNLTVALPGSAWENAGVLTNAGSVSLAGTSATAIVISLASGNPSKLIVPSSVTISAGSLSNTFNVTPVDDPLVEGHQLIAVTASATGFTNGSAAMWVLDKETPPFPFNPRPGNLAANVPANTNLTWSSSSNTTELILNGGFETGSLANWTQVPNSLYDGKFYTNNGTLKPYSPDPALPPYAGGYSALGDEYGPGIFYMYQTVSIPANATSATLSWAHRVRNFYSSFSTSQQFQVRICDTANNILATPFTTSPGDPLLGDWVQESYDMTAFAGQTVRVMFWVNSQLYYIDAHVDNVSVQANVPTANPLGVITNDVYFGVNPTPGPAEFQGSTTNTSWALPLLAPLTTYYWQIIAHRVGSATGAVWQFTTAGVDHFAWNTISTPQLVNQPFSATITAKDAFNTTVSNFTGPVALNGTSGGGQITNSILGSPIHTFSGSVNSFTDGTAFTPNTNLTVTHVRHYFGNKVSIWTDGGVLLAAQNVTSVPGTWVETPLATPIQLMAGIRYRVGIYRTGVVNYWRTDMAGVFPNGTIDQSYEVSGDAFPTTSDSARWWFVDLRYTVGTSVAVTVTPTNSGNFVNGSWTGNMTVQQPATNVILLANDGNQHTGSSNPFDVVLTNDLSINIVDSPHPVSVGASLTYTLTVANTGPADSTGVMVTNLLTAGATFVSATSSQGTCGQNGGVVTCNLGVVHGGTNATVTIVVVPTAAGMNLTNVATVSRNEAESYLGNNTATTITPVTPPAISIADASVIEGNVGTTNMIFAVTLAVPGAQTITVNYATSDGTATTGSDYVATNGVLTFPPGATNGTISVAVIGNIFVESNKTLFVTLSNPVNGVLVRAQATGTIINDDGLPGDVYSIVWSAIPSPQLAGQPFGVTITALDYSNNVATNFNGTVALSAGTVAINPANSGNFTNGVWSGSVTVPQHETNVVVRADDGNGHVGLSNPFVVALTNTAPVILVQPTNQIVMVSSNVTVSVTADGTPPLAYQWNFGGTNIMDATNAILTLANVQLTNAGNYAVVITNIYGLVTSSNAVLTVLVAPPCDPAPSGLVAWWQGEGNANDSIGANNGSINGGVAYTNGELGQAFSLDGTSGFVSVPAGSSLDVGLSNGFTIEGWVNPTTTATQRPILEWTTGGNIGVHFWISADNYGGLKVGSLYANLVDTGGGYHSFSSGAGLLFTNQFQHVALTYDKSSGTGRLYLNGLVVTQQNLGVFTPETSLNLNLGTRPGTTYFWSGLLDEISLYSRALSSNEIAGIYNSGSGGKCPVPPIILSQPTNQTVSVGGTATFSVSANGIPPFFYQWNFNGTNIVGATNTSLTLTNVQLNQAGYYAVLVANAGGSTIS